MNNIQILNYLLKHGTCLNNSKIQCYMCPLYHSEFRLCYHPISDIKTKLEEYKIIQFLENE